MTNSLNCPVCNRMLVIGSAMGDNAEWCPNCEGFHIYSKKDALKHINDEIDLHLGNIQRIQEKYSKDSLIGSLLCHREGLLRLFQRKNSLDLEEFISISYLIKLIVNTDNCEFGNKYIEAPRRDFHEIINRAKSISHQLKFIEYINNEICLLVKIPKSKLPQYLNRFDENQKYDPEPIDKISEIQFKFTKKWIGVVSNFKKYGLLSNLDLIITKNKKDSSEYSKITKLKEAIALTMQFKMSCNIKELIDFSFFKNNRELADLLSKIAIDVLPKSSFNCNTDNDTFMCGIIPIKEYDLKKYESDDSYTILISNLTFTTDKCEGFPLIFRSKKGFLIPSFTCQLVHKYVIAKYFIDIDLENSIEGIEFEEEISNKLNKLGIVTYAPNDCSKKLLNVKDDENNPSLEIDIIGHTKDTIWVIECKHFALEDSFLRGDRKKVIRRKLLQMKIDEKQNQRIQFVKSNKSRWGFGKKIKYYKSVIITLLDESIEKINNTYIIPEINIDSEIFKVCNYNYADGN